MAEHNSDYGQARKATYTGFGTHVQCFAHGNMLRRKVYSNCLDMRILQAQPTNKSGFGWTCHLMSAG